LIFFVSLAFSVKSVSLLIYLEQLDKWIIVTRASH